MLYAACYIENRSRLALNTHHLKICIHDIADIYEISDRVRRSQLNIFSLDAPQHKFRNKPPLFLPRSIYRKKAKNNDWETGLSGTVLAIEGCRRFACAIGRIWLKNIGFFHRTCLASVFRRTAGMNKFFKANLFCRPKEIYRALEIYFKN